MALLVILIRFVTVTYTEASYGERIMGTFRDAYEVGQEMFQFWSKFKGRRVRVWPSELTIRICSESGKKWVTSAEGHEPYWWEESRKRYEEQRPNAALSPSGALVEFAAQHLADTSVPQIETIEQAKLFEGTVSEIVKQPPGIHLTEIQYWVVVDTEQGEKVVKIDSTDEAIFLPFNQLARIDFVSAGPFRVVKHETSWE